MRTKVYTSEKRYRRDNFRFEQPIKRLENMVVSTRSKRLLYTFTVKACFIRLKMVSRETILVYVKKYQKPLLILGTAWVFMVGAVTMKIATLLMSTGCE